MQDFELAKLYGIVSIDEKNKIVDFHEKPEHPKSTLSSTGIYLYPYYILQKLIQFVKSGGKKDKAGDFLEWVYKQEDIYAYVTVLKWFDIGNLEQLKKARAEFNG